jgi:cytochrome c oxidase assembly protein subunit 15
MTLAGFKVIFFWEWFHRLLGRVIGLAFALPLAWFWAKRAIPQGYHLRLVGLLLLGGLQGAVGWWMVKSGLTQDVKVSHLRLATHLSLALLTLSLLVWTALDLKRHALGRARARLTGLGAAALAVLALQLFYGALVAGLRAGPVSGGGWLSWDAWPLMQGRLFPAGIDWSEGTLHTLTGDPYLVHFVHRWWAWVAVAVLVVLARALRPLNRRTSVAIHSAFGTQILLGIATVWSGTAIWLAALHQLTGAVLLAATVWGVHILGRERHDSKG